MNTLSALSLFVLRAVEALQAQGSAVTRAKLHLVVPADSEAIDRTLEQLDALHLVYCDLGDRYRLTLLGLTTVIQRIGLRRPAACDRRQARPYLHKHLAKAGTRLRRVA